MTGGDLLVQSLQAHGVPFLTTVCGNGLPAILDSCRRGGLRVIDTRTEHAAAYLADAYARLTARVGVVASSSGIAHIHALAGVANARFDGAPLLLITGESASAGTDHGAFQELDHCALARPLCKYVRRVLDPPELGFYVAEAISHATSGRPGPVHLAIPVDVTETELSSAGLPPQRPGPIGPRAPGPADSEAVERAAALLDAAERPLLIAGSGAFYAQAADAVHELAGAAAVPIAVPIWDRGVIGPSDQHFVGVVGAASGEPDILPQADLLVLVGARLDYRLGYGRPPTVAPEARILRVEADAAELDRGVQPTVALQGHPRSVLEQLATVYRARGGRRHREWLADAQARNRRFRARWWEIPAPPSPPMSGRHLVDALRPYLDGDVTFLVDGGNIGQWVHQVLADRYPPNWLTCGSSAVVGWGIPGAMGARLAFPERPAILLSGDGAVHFALSDLESAVRHGLPFTLVLADDRAWGIVASEQRAAHGEDGLIASVIGPVDYALVAQGLGARGVRADSVDELHTAMRDALNADQPTLIHVPIAHGGPAD